MKRIYWIIYFNNSFHIHWQFQLDWCIISTGDVLLHSSYIIPPFGCFRKGAAISFLTKNEKPHLTTSHFLLWDFFYSPHSYKEIHPYAPLPVATRGFEPRAARRPPSDHSNNLDKIESVANQVA